MDTFFNVDLVSVATAITGIGLLSPLIYFHKPHSVTARTFLYLAAITIAWSVANYLQYQRTGPLLGLLLIRSIVFLGTWHAFFFFRFCTVFPREEYEWPAWHDRILVPITLAVSAVTVTPLVFQTVKNITANGTVTAVNPGPAMPLFVLFVGTLIIAGITIMARNGMATKGVGRSRFLIVAAGMALTFAAIILFNLIFPAFFNDAQYLPLSSVFIFPFVASIFFALYRYRLFQIRVVSTEMFVFLLAVVTAFQVLFSNGIAALVFHASTFILTLVFSVLLVQNVVREVTLRETIEAQEAELEKTNQNQENLLHFISHEIKGYLTKGEGAFASLAEGDYGVLAPPVKALAEGGLAEMRKGVDTVMNILDASNLKRGSITFDKETFDMAATVRETLHDLHPAIEHKGLALETRVPDAPLYVVGDQQKIRRHVVRNLVDNAMRYTPSGSITVSLEQKDGRIVFSVKDTGVGIDDEDKGRLFTEGGHGKNSIKVNVDSTGYGLFIAHQVVVAHHGTIRAESEGEGKGAMFVVELPAA